MDWCPAIQPGHVYCPAKIDPVTCDVIPILSCGVCQIEREVTESMMKSLKYCDLQTESARQPLYQYRAATIHHRLASMYHSCFRNQVRRSHPHACFIFNTVLVYD